MTSKELLAEQRAGAVILHNGAEVEYSPRYRGDRYPWVWAEDSTGQYRYTAAQCVAHRKEAGA